MDEADIDCALYDMVRGAS